MTTSPPVPSCAWISAKLARVSGTISQNQVKHLEFIQSVITRLATNSFLMKGWCITAAGVLFGLAINRKSIGISLIALVPVVAFALLDSYFLRQERLYRHLYNDVRDPLSSVEPFLMNTAPYAYREAWSKVIASITISVFYGSLLIVGLIVVGVVAMD
jgi:hypothetical protein